LSQSLVPGEVYTIQVSGTYEYGHGPADAAYATYYDWSNIRTDIGLHPTTPEPTIGAPAPGVCCLLVDFGDGIAIADWGSYRSDHVYTYSFTATSPILGFVISDWWGDWPFPPGAEYDYQNGMGDNYGFLTVTVASLLIASFNYYNLVEGEAMEGPAMAGGEIIFRAEGSSGNIVRYDWEFKNEQTGSTVLMYSVNGPADGPSVVFPEPEKYVATLKVTDDDGAQATATKILNLTLEPGDLIFLRSGPPFSSLFNWMGQNYTHVGMYVGEVNGTHVVVESAAKFPFFGNPFLKRDGVQVTPFERWSVKYETYATVYTVNESKDTKDAAVRWAVSKVGHKYDRDSIVYALRDKGLGWPYTGLYKQIDRYDGDLQSSVGEGFPRGQAKKIGDAYYCSELIWAAYYSASRGAFDLSIGVGPIPTDWLLLDSTHVTEKQWHREHYPIW
jgi:uncharacterized protein YycO